MDTNKHEWNRGAAVVEDSFLAHGHFVRAATGASHTVALRSVWIRVHWCSFVV